MFALPPAHGSHGVTFEPDTKEEIKARKNHHKKEKKVKGKHGRKNKENKKEGKEEHKRKPKCCKAVGVFLITLFAAHFYTLKKLANSLLALEQMGGNMNGYKKSLKEKKEAAKVDEEQPVVIAPTRIEYSFDEHLDKEEEPVITAPINYSINESTTQMQ